MLNEPGDSEQQKPSAIDRILDFILERNRLNQRLHWTTIVSEKTLLAIIGMLTVVASADAIFSIFVVAVNFSFVTFSKITSYPGSSFNGKILELILSKSLAENR